MLKGCRMKRAKIIGRILVGCWIVILFVWLARLFFIEPTKQTTEGSSSDSVASSAASQIPQNEVKTARIMANGDLLYHIPLFRYAKQADGTYDFKENYTYVKPWLEQADLAIGDFEGTVRPNYPLAGYPLFNAPDEVVDAIKDAGYDVLDLAHNHILDSGITGIQTTVEAFESRGLTTIGVYTKQPRSQSDIVIKEVNGIKIALLAYSYGFNGIEASISDEDYQAYLSDLNETLMQAEIEKAEQLADITIVMPQMGVEYALQPNAEQKRLYHLMVEWGADIVFGGHPHVVQPAEVVEHNGDNKLIIYSMGNFLSNQRIETLSEDTSNAKWTERGVLMDVVLKKENDKTIIETATAHPTWVNRIETGMIEASSQRPIYIYETYILEDFIEDGKHRSELSEATKERIDLAYKEMIQHVQLEWPTN